MKAFKQAIIAILMLLSASACTTPQPQNIDNICAIFRQYPSWYWAAQDAQKRWYTPISVLMAIIHQESGFNANAKPPRTHILWIIPWFRPSSSFGYAQALNQTWQRYENAIGKHASRNNFKDAINFIGWFTTQAHARAGISRTNAYGMYLAFHEGIGGFQRKTYLRKRWLIAVAHKVSLRSYIYHKQLLRCQRSLPRKPWYYRLFGW